MFSPHKALFAVSVLSAALLMPVNAAFADSEPTRLVMGPFSAVYNDDILAGASEAGRTYTVRSSGFTVNDLQQMQKKLDDNNKALNELQSLKQTVSEQARQIEALKRDTGSAHNTGASELSRLTRTTQDQQKALDKLAQQVEDLKRSAGSNSSANDLAALKREVSDQNREMDGLKRNVEDLSRKVK